MILQILRDAATAFYGFVKAGKKTRHGLWVIACCSEGMQADAVGFLLILTAVVQLVLRHGRLRRVDRCSTGVALATGTESDGSEDAGEKPEHVVGAVHHHARIVSLPQMSKFMRQHRGHFGFIVGG